LTPGQAGALTAELRDASGAKLTGRTISWISSDQGIATVSEMGIVIGVAVGPATISASAEGKSGSAQVTVAYPSPTQVVILLPATPVRAGETSRLFAVAADAQGQVVPVAISVAWQVLDPVAATIAEDGALRAYLPGPFRVRASDPTGVLTAATTMVTVLPPEPWAGDPWNVTFDQYPWDAFGIVSLVVPIGAVLQAKVLISSPDAGGQPIDPGRRFLTWGSTNTIAAEVNDDGVVHALQGGYSCITVTIQSRSRCANLLVVGDPGNVPLPSIQVTGLPPTMAVGDSVHVTATLLGAGPAPVVWGSHSSALEISPDGWAYARRVGSVTVSTTIGHLTVLHGLDIQP
jgi:hypothetical protein